MTLLLGPVVPVEAISNDPMLILLHSNHYVVFVVGTVGAVGFDTVDGAKVVSLFGNDHVIDVVDPGRVNSF